MAKKIAKQSVPAKNTEAKKPVVAAAPKESSNFFRNYANIMIPLGIAIITFLFLYACLDNQLLDWDDNGYITENTMIRDISSDGIKKIFSTTVMGNFHPLTVLSYALEYSKVQLDPGLYHLDNLILHLIVTILVYWFILLLSRNRLIAAITSLLFGLHPMHS